MAQTCQLTNMCKFYPPPLTHWSSRSPNGNFKYKHSFSLKEKIEFAYKMTSAWNNLFKTISWEEKYNNFSQQINNGRGAISVRESIQEVKMTNFWLLLTLVSGIRCTVLLNFNFLA